jgi:hypothetical protein
MSRRKNNLGSDVRVASEVGDDKKTRLMARVKANPGYIPRLSQITNRREVGSYFTVGNKAAQRASLLLLHASSLS